jgi:hypothetical protein
MTEYERGLRHGGAAAMPHVALLRDHIDRFVTVQRDGGFEGDRGALYEAAIDLANAVVCARAAFPALRTPPSSETTIERCAKVAEAYPTEPPFGDLYTADNLVRHGQDCAAKDIAKFIRRPLSLSGDRGMSEGNAVAAWLRRELDLCERSLKLGRHREISSDTVRHAFIRAAEEIERLAAAPEPPSPSPELREALEALRECREYFDDRADIADRDGWPPIPNDAMRIATMLNTILAKHAVTLKAEEE